MHFANPANDIADIVPSVVAVPLVAFNKNLYRLGYGGGFYDRYLAEYKSKVQLKIGLAFSMQECNDFNTNDFDVKLDYILTEDYDLRS
jgi:5-formyltetrahydrofolate cyclo-ligase